MRIAIKDLKVGAKFSMNDGGRVLEVVSVADGMIAFKGGEVALKRIPAQDRAVWLVEAPKAAPAPAPKVEKAAEAPKVKKAKKAAAPKFEAPEVEEKIEAPEAE